MFFTSSDQKQLPLKLRGASMHSPPPTDVPEPAPSPDPDPAPVPSPDPIPTPMQPPATPPMDPPTQPPILVDDKRTTTAPIAEPS